MGGDHIILLIPAYVFTSGAEVMKYFSSLLKFLLQVLVW
jgi:hypothetical protein